MTRGIAHVTKIAMEPVYAESGPGLAASGTELIATLEFQGKTYKWAVAPGQFRVGQEVHVAITDQNILVIARP